MNDLYQKAGAFVLEVMSNDYFRFQDVQFGFKMLSVVIEDNVAILKYSFYSDPSVHDEQSFKLFDYEDDSNGNFFPASINLVTIEESYTWESNESLNEFDEDGLISCEDLDYDIKNYKWDDIDFPEDALNWALESIGDDYSIAITISKYFKKHGKLPPYVPKVLKKRFKKILEEFSED